MPWHIETDQAGCDGYAVVKDDTGETVPGGCHATLAEAEDHLTALNIAEAGTRAINLDVPQYIRDAAARGLELRAEGYGGDGLVDRTIREARLMADGQISEDKVIRANAWARVTLSISRLCRTLTLMRTDGRGTVQSRTIFGESIRPIPNRLATGSSRRVPQSRPILRANAWTIWTSSPRSIPRCCRR